MKLLTVTHENLPQAVKVALEECLLQLDAAKRCADSKLERDLNSALYALRLIDSELRNPTTARPKHLRSAAFIRYVIDEEPNMVMNEECKQFVVRIEDIYKRYDVK